MVSFLLIISFLLHLVALGAIYKLFQHIQTSKKQDLQEIESLFEAYLQEIKSENSRLQTQLQSQRKLKQEANPENKPITEQKDESTELMEEDMEQYIASKNEDMLIASKESKVLQMYDKGMATSDIARKLECGKTEVEIILKMHKKSV